MPILSTIAAATIKAYGFLRQLAGGAQDSNFENVTLLLPGNGTNGAQNNTFIDSSSNAFTVTRNGNTTQGSNSPQSRPAGEWGVYFDGSGDYLTVPHISSFNPNTYVSLECFVCFSSLNSNILIVGRQGMWLSYSYAGIGGSANKIAFSLYDGSWVTANSTSTININQWYHIVGVRDNTTLRIYINGVQEGTATFSGTASTYTTDFSIGGLFTGGDYVTGYLSNVRYCNGSTSGALPYTGTSFTVPTSSLTTTTDTVLLACQKNRFVDSSANASTIVINGNPTVQAFNPFEPADAYSSSSDAGSGYWDGTGDYLQLAQNALWRFGSGDFTIETYLWIDNPTNDMTQNLAFHWNGTTNGDVIGTTDVYSNCWNHVAVTRTGTTLRFWINGVADAGNPQTISSTIYNDNDPLMIGRGADHTTGAGRDICHCGETGGAANKWFFYLRNGGTGSFKGYMAGFRISNSVRYTSTFTPPTLPMTSDANTSLLLNFINAGIYDAAAFSDFETVGNAQISTSTSKWGGSSIGGFNGSSYLISYNGITMGNFGSGDFTVECWVKTTPPGSGPGLFAQANGSGAANTSWGFFIGYASSTSIDFYLSNGTTYFANTGGGNVTDDAWHHVAFSRSGSSGKLFLDGTQVGSTLSLGTTALGNGTQPITVGSQGSVNPLPSGNVQDLRITKGIARYTANFTPPDAAFPLF